MYKKFHHLLTLLLIPVFSWAQPSMPDLKISGKVLDEVTNKQLEYVNIALYSARDSSLITGTISDDMGHFEIQPKRPGKYFVKVDFMGYEMRTVADVMLRPDSPSFNMGEVRLNRANIDIAEVEITAEKPFVTYEIDRKVIDVSKNPSAQGGTAVDALENVPSVEIDIEGNVALRGNSNFTVLIDGRQSILSGTDALNAIPSGAIQTIEIITNPSAKYDPDGTAGIINVVTKKGKYQGHSLLINASAGNSPMYSTDINYSMRKKKFTINTSLNISDREMQFNSNDYRTTITSDSLGNVGLGIIDNDRNGSFGHSNTRFSAGIDYFITPSNTFSISGAYSDFTFERKFESQISNTSVYNETIYQKSETAFGANPHSYQVNIGDRQVFNDDDKHFLSVDFMYQISDQENNDFLNTYDIDQTGNYLYPYNPGEKAVTSEDNTRIRLEANYSQPVSEKLFFEAGYTLRKDGYTQQYNRLAQSGSDEVWMEETGFADQAEFDRIIHAGWATIKGKLLGMQYATGLRLEYTDRNLATIKDSWDFNYNYLGLYPSFSLAKEWGDGHIVQSSYTRRINRPRDHHMNPFPGLTDGYVIYKPNPEIEPEYATSVELNYQKMWGANFVAIESFYRHTTNEMDRISEVQGNSIVRTIINLGSELDAGGEMVISYKPFKWWLINPMASMSYHEVEGTYINENVTKSNIDYRASFSTNFFLPTKTRIQLQSSYRSPRKEIDGDREADFYVSGAVRQEFFDRQLGATLRVDDILGTRKRDQWTYTETTTVHSVGKRKSPMIVISLQYRFNQQDGERRGGRGENGDGGGGEMDMEF